MKIKELIELIKDLSPEAEVIIENEKDGGCEIPSRGRVVDLGGCYFGGKIPAGEDNDKCLLLSVE